MWGGVTDLGGDCPSIAYRVWMLTVLDYARVVSCEACSAVGKLLRDSGENVPQPGFVGRRYGETGVFLVGQNPGVPTVGLAARDKAYTAALRSLRDNQTKQSLLGALGVMRDFVPSWPISGSYFPLEECGMTLDDIAYCNVVRCRTVSNSPPPTSVADRCGSLHFQAWLDALQPSVVVFVGKWARDRVGHMVQAKGIPADFMNRARDLSSQARMENRDRVAKLVRAVVAGRRG